MGDQPLSRRRVLGGLAALPLGAALARVGSARASSGTLAATPACDDSPTPKQTEGPYWTPDSPPRSDLTGDGAPGDRMTLTGTVVDTACRPVADTLLDFWQCDGNGVYDNEGFTLRGHQYSDANGAFRLVTVKPGLYPGRTRHFHVKVRPPGGEVLTTQLYFPGEPANQADGIYRRELEMTVADNGDASFTFVVES
ncbi:MAG TPA: intradiol ring-cleavage dioxygenase [Acidimicrobiia bacterium]|nr:intradiol ring-cleavage dioxygenase [Acidimicrobiia bacterium]